MIRNKGDPKGLRLTLPMKVTSPYVNVEWTSRKKDIMLLLVIHNRIFLIKETNLSTPDPLLAEAHQFLSQECLWSGPDKEWDIKGAAHSGYEFMVDSKTGKLNSKNGLAIGELVQKVYDIFAQRHIIVTPYPQAVRILKIQLYSILSKVEVVNELIYDHIFDVYKQWRDEYGFSIEYCDPDSSYAADVEALVNAVNEECEKHKDS